MLIFAGFTLITPNVIAATATVQEASPSGGGGIEANNLPADQGESVEVPTDVVQAEETTATEGNTTVEEATTPEEVATTVTGDTTVQDAATSTVLNETDLTSQTTLDNDVSVETQAVVEETADQGANIIEVAEPVQEAAVASVANQSTVATPVQEGEVVVTAAEQASAALVNSGRVDQVLRRNVETNTFTESSNVIINAQQSDTVVSVAEVVVAAERDAQRMVAADNTHTTSNRARLGKTAQIAVANAVRTRKLQNTFGQAVKTSIANRGNDTSVRQTVRQVVQNRIRDSKTSSNRNTSNFQSAISNYSAPIVNKKNVSLGKSRIQGIVVGNPHVVLQGEIDPNTFKNLREMRVNKLWVYVDPQGQFASLQPVVKGKNIFNVTLLTKDNKIQAYPITISSNVETGANNPILQEGKKIALLVSAYNYTDPKIPDLVTPKTDVTSIAKVLKDRYGFEVHVLDNATKEQFFKKLASIASSSVLEDQVLVYYTGHGYVDETTNTGYWLLKNANLNDLNGWVGNDDVSSMLRQLIPARKIMLLSDSCYSGVFIRANNQQAEDISPREQRAMRSVLAISSGGFEPVDDGEQHSPFASALISVLESNKHSETATNLFASVKKHVINRFPQTPRFGVVVEAGHDRGGEFVFFPN
ncbi:hypothetical protein TI03_00300 [Achromatium sp. WMS1]|nr:hypothetical protein TI03_00300 [Achromatium sp. WMS1]